MFLFQPCGAAGDCKRSMDETSSVRAWNTKTIICITYIICISNNIGTHNICSSHPPSATHNVIQILRPPTGGKMHLSPLLMSCNAPPTTTLPPSTPACLPSYAHSHSSRDSSGGLLLREDDVIGLKVSCLAEGAPSEVQQVRVSEAVHQPILGLPPEQVLCLVVGRKEVLRGAEGRGGGERGGREGEWRKGRGREEGWDEPPLPAVLPAVLSVSMGKPLVAHRGALFTPVVAGEYYLLVHISEHMRQKL